MSSSYHVDPKRNLVLVRPTGHFTETRFIQLCQALYDDPDRKPHFSSVWDVRAIDELVMDAEVIPMYRAFLRENADRLTQGRVAIITDREIATTFASMLIEVGRKQVGPYELFGSLSAAAAWVGVSPQALSDPPSPRRVPA